MDIIQVVGHSIIDNPFIRKAAKKGLLLMARPLSPPPILILKNNKNNKIKI